MKKYFLVWIVFCFWGTSLRATVTLPKIFADNMVLQRNKPIPIWGWASANENVQVQLNKQVKAVRSDKDGKWMVKLDPESAGGPYQLTIKGENTVQLKNVLVGEVWICSGQSNMEWTVSQSENAQRAISEANNPYIRHIKIPKVINSLPDSDIKNGTWQVCNPSTVGDFTAVGYFFAKNVYAETKIPIGLINASWGGTNIETWISREGFEGSEEFKEMIMSMPKVSLDSLSKWQIASIEKRIENLQHNKLMGRKADVFKEFSFDDSTWPVMELPKVWEKQALGALDGVVWLRKTIDLKNIGKAILALAKIDDQDITYINGVNVGSAQSWDDKRTYTVPPGILKEGKNTIAVRVVDTGGDGGVYGSPDEMKLTIGDTEIPLSGFWKYQVESVSAEVNQNNYPSLVFNSMINPLVPFAIRGVLWYQGESNVDRAFQYQKAFPLLINDWRKKWNQGAFPFYYVQLATFATPGNSNEGCSWAELREAQTLALQLNNTGMCVTTDIGNPSDIHPLKKQEVGKRLSAIALHQLYQRPMVYSSPKYRSMKVDGNQAVITFEDMGTGLFTPDPSGQIKGFEIAGKDRVFHYAKAFIKGDNTVVVYHEQVENPVAVHFGWKGDASDNNLYNKEGFPAIPFRTDNWMTITKDTKYKIQ